MHRHQLATECRRLKAVIGCRGTAESTCYTSALIKSSQSHCELSRLYIDRDRTRCDCRMRHSARQCHSAFRLAHLPHSLSLCLRAVGRTSNFRDSLTTSINRHTPRRLKFYHKTSKKQRVSTLIGQDTGRVCKAQRGLARSVCPSDQCLSTLTHAADDSPSGSTRGERGQRTFRPLCPRNNNACA